MGRDRVTWLDLLRNAGIDPALCLRLAWERFLQDLMEADVAARVGADRSERPPDRTPPRNGHRDRDGRTRLGTVPRQIPQLRQGTYFPNFLEPRRRREQACAAVIQEAYVLGGQRPPGGRAGAGVRPDGSEPILGLRLVPAPGRARGRRPDPSAQRAVPVCLMSGSMPSRSRCGRGIASSAGPG
ncbi:MAG: transposase [Actinomycetia bacterium]|nr:transposase [Actinomycetes bacterium]